MQDTLRVRMPTGIPSLDPVLDGGIPPGSVVLLLGDVGAGNTEFVYSSLISLVALKKRGGTDAHIRLPEEITYVTITRMKDDILHDIVLSFKSDFASHLAENVSFADLSDMYFDASIVPPEWYGDGDIISRMQKKHRRESGNLLADLAHTLGSCKPDGLVVVDSLTDVATAYSDDASWHSFIAFLRGLQRVSKRWRTTIYLLLSTGILERAREIEITDCADAVMQFRWEDVGGQRRQRIMFFAKFLGVMPYLEERDLVKFAVTLSAANGFEVRNIRVVV